MTSVTNVMPSLTTENKSDELRETSGLTKEIPLSNGNEEVRLL